MLKELKKPEIVEIMIPIYFIAIAAKFCWVDIFAQIPAYSGASFLPEKVWAAIFFIAGALQFLATRLDHYRFRVIMLNICAGIWLIWAAIIFFARPNGFGDIIWTFSAVSCFLTFYRLNHSPIKE